MDQSDPLEVIDGIGIFRPAGSYRFQQAVALVTNAIVKARGQDLKKILVICDEITGFQSPSLSERYWMEREWVVASDGQLKVAMVVLAAFIDPEKFGIVAPANFGVTSEVFTLDTDAMTWLRNIS